MPVTPDSSSFTRNVRTIRPLTSALARLADVMRGRTVQDWQELFRLGEFLAVETAAARCDHRLRGADRPRETRAKQEDSCRWAIRKFLVTSGFFDRLAASEGIDAAEEAQKFFRWLYCQSGVITMLVPLEGVPPQDCQLSEHVRLVTLTEEALDKLSRLEKAEESPIRGSELVGRCALEVRVFSSKPDHWDGPDVCRDAQQRIFGAAWPYLSLLLLHPQSDGIRPLALLEWSTRIVDYPGLRLEILSRPKRYHRLSPPPPRLPPTSSTSSHSTAADIGHFVQSLARCRTTALLQSVRVDQALHYYTEAAISLAKHPLEEDLDEQMVGDVLLRLYQVLEKVFAPERRGSVTPQQIASPAMRFFHGSDYAKRRLHHLLSLGYDLPSAIGEHEELTTRGEVIDTVRLVRQIARGALVSFLQRYEDREELG